MKPRTLISFVDRDFPATPYFIDFLDDFINKKGTATNWHDQLSENLQKQSANILENARKPSPKILRDPLAQKALNRSHELMVALLTGSTEKLVPFHNLFKFIVVVGIPRSGGSYLTKQLFDAIGMDATQVPRVIAHDGFPELSPFFMANGYNAYTGMQRRMAEYLTMVELYFAKSRLHGGYLIVPKKASKAAYQGAFFNAITGSQTEYVITIRHPIACCVSTYEKSGGLPESGKFMLRSAIEAWAARDYVLTSKDPESEIFSKDYFDVYLRFWEQYHCNLALTGLSANKNWTIVPYTQEYMQSTAEKFFSRFDASKQANTFKTFDKRNRHPEWNDKADASILRVHNLWQSIGLQFPVDEIRQAW